MGKKSRRERKYDKFCNCLHGGRPPFLNNVRYEKEGYDFKWEYSELYRACLTEAFKLLQEAQILFDNKHYERSYFLAFSSLEEIAKSQMAADVFTGLLCEDAYQITQNNHRKKSERVAWIRKNLITISDDISNLLPFDCEKKFRAMYPDLVDGSVLRPKDAISAGDAENVMRAGMLGLQEIYNVTVVNGHQIGTKGFMK